jgi:hypothetical protein
MPEANEAGMRNLNDCERAVGRAYIGVVDATGVLIISGDRSRRVDAINVRSLFNLCARTRCIEGDNCEGMAVRPLTLPKIVVFLGKIVRTFFAHHPSRMRITRMRPGRWSTQGSHSIRRDSILHRTKDNARRSRRNTGDSSAIRSEENCRICRSSF